LLSTLLFSFYLTLSLPSVDDDVQRQSKVKDHFFPIHLHPHTTNVKTPRHIFFHPSSSTHYKRKNSTTHFFQGCQGGGQVSERFFFLFGEISPLGDPKKKWGPECES
jgi:hypothetical protein